MKTVWSMTAEISSPAPRARGDVVALLLTLLATLHQSSALPAYFLNASRELIPSDQNCIAHPSTYSQYVKNRRHGTGPTPDSGITFQAFNAAGDSPSNVLCPGLEHTLTVSFNGTPRVALLNSNPPLVSFKTPSPTPGCPNQVILGWPTQISFSTRFTVPCTAAGHSLLFKITSVGQDDYRWKTANLSLEVAGRDSPETAPGGACAAAAAACGTGFCTRSSLGYDCMAEWRNVTVHWSVNRTSAPDNPCTPAAKTLLQAEDVAQDGSLHMAVQSAATGYVALGFAVTAGRMVPSDIIMGWAVDASNTSVSTFDTSKNVSLGTSNNTANSWAYDRGVSYNASSGITTLCFSRRLADPRSVATPDLRASSTGLLAINFAVSGQDRLVKHAASSVGGFNLDLALGVVPVSPPSPPPPPSQLPSPPPSPPPSPAPVVSAPPACAPSTLGYQCSVQRGKITLHWTLNAPVAPDNNCTPSSKTVLQADELTRVGALHIAVESRTQGYVALGFADNPTNMYPSDIMMGWLDSSGRASVNAYYVTGSYIDTDDVVSSSWAYDTGVSYNASSSVTTLCFSRRLLDERAKVSADLRAVAGNGSSGTSAAGSRRRLLDAAEGSSSLSFIWAVSPTAALVKHPEDGVGGFYLDVSTGDTEEAEDDEQYWINVHGALMAVAWGLLLPLGTLLPAHRWLLGGSEVGGKALWFWLHLICQWTGVALFVAGFVVAFVKFEEVEGELVEAHRDIGIAVMAAAGAQVVFAYVRPAPDHPRRGFWNLIHHNLGRATVMLAWANVYIGIVVSHTDNAASYAPWVAPIATVMGLLVITDLVLRVVGWSRRDPALKAGDIARAGADGGNGRPLTNLADAPAKQGTNGQAA